MRARRGAQSGVTLIELLTVMVVVGILAAVSIPAYRSYVRRAGRVDAKTALENAAGTLERCFTRFNAYNNANCTLVVPYTTENGEYQIDADAGNGGIGVTTFALQATPLGGQTDDLECATFKLDQTGLRTVTGTLNATPLRCWNR
jgi:type IV pilus assembly protein PilE